VTNNISTDLVFFISKDKACEELNGGRHEESEEGDKDIASDSEEKQLREEAIYEKQMVSLQI
jgi:hypothetical protein